MRVVSCLRVKGNKMQYNTIQYNTIQYNTIQYNTIQYNTIQCNTMQCTTLHYTTLHYTTLHYTTLHYTTLHYTAKRCNTIQFTTHRLSYDPIITWSPEGCMSIEEIHLQAVNSFLTNFCSIK